jgi:hypothetical protein
VNHARRISNGHSYRDRTRVFLRKDSASCEALALSRLSVLPFRYANSVGTLN